MSKPASPRPINTEATNARRFIGTVPLTLTDLAQESFSADQGSRKRGNGPTVARLLKIGSACLSSCSIRPLV